ncbi:hypothetical protein Tco_0140651 [Tanacetum coccineum]
MAYFRSLHSHLQVLSKDDLKGTRIEHGFKRAFMSLFGQDVDTFTRTMLLNVDQLQKQLDKDEFQEDGSMTAFWVVNNQFQKFIDSKFTLDYDSQMTDTYFVEYTGIEVKHFRDTLLQHMGNVKKSVAERTRHQRQYDRRVNKRQLQTQESKIDTGKAVDNGLTIEQTTSLLANNADLKAQIQEKVFAIAALKNDLRKLKGNSVDTKFDKTSVLGKPVLQSPRNQSVVRQPNAFKSERPQMSKQRFASQVDVNNNLSKPVTQHYLPKKRESVFAKPDHMIASSESRNSSKNMPRFSSNDMVHNHYLDEAKKKTQERDRNSKTSVTPSARFKSTADDSKPKPRNNNQTPRSLHVSKSSCVTIMAVPKADHSKSSSSFSDSKNFVCSTCHKCVFNANHDACITKLLKEVNSRVKTQSHKTRNSNKPADQKSHTQKPARQIFTGYRFSPNKTSAMYEETSSRSDLRWKPTGIIFKSVGLRWIPTGKLFDSCTSKVDSEPPHGSNVDIPNIHECKQTLDESAVFSKPSAVTTIDASDKRQQQPDPTSSTSTLATTVTANGNFNVHVKRGRDTKIPQSSGPPVKVGDEAVHKELGDRMERAATTASSLEAEQDSGNINRTNPWQHLMSQVLRELVQSNDPPLSRVNTLGSGEDSMKLMELMAHFLEETSTARTTDDGEVEIIASIDGKVKTITEASLRRHLKLEDSDGITSLPNTKILEQVALIGYVSASARLTFQKGHFLISGADEAAFISVDVDAGGAATTDIGLEAGQGSVEVLKNDMQQTKKVYSSALTKLILRVKKLEKKVKTNKARRMARIVILDDEDAEEDSSKQERKIFKIDKDPTILLVHPEQDMEYDFDVISPLRVSIAEDISGAETLVYIRRSAEKRKDKGKAIMKEDEFVQKKTKTQLEQERLGHEEAIRLQE